ncbi:antibiotic biosynthesis monooxygenase [Amphritea sp.]|uniref:antibiotic biosynthesis monooxygenase family protein n=1 Tax=Amphritea sp. TaxID=1872502 RepID=UPI0025BE689D|nr:antibiotic biosynthesis monooxygenase [Amphritea sp.]
MMMFAVIFRAEIAQLDEEYSVMAARMRDLAMQEYGCREFTAVTEGNSEIAISYWDSQDQIRAWKENAEHLVAQRKGRAQWYVSYKVQIVEVVREYSAG